MIWLLRSSPSNRFLVSFILSLALLGLAVPSITIAHDHGKVRMYKLNKKDQPIRQKWLSNTDKAGCHGTRKTRAVFRFAQVGYDYCILYAKENCAEGFEVPGKWGGKKYKNAEFDIDEPQIRLLRGTEWYLNNSQNTSIKSWFCAYAPD